MIATRTVGEMPLLTALENVQTEMYKLRAFNPQFKQ